MSTVRPLLVIAALALAGLPAPSMAQEAFGARDTVMRDAVSNLEAYAVYKMGRYDQAAAIWTELAERGNTTAMINLANMHAQGQGRPRDPAAAEAWLRRAAELGDERAVEDLAAQREAAGAGD